MTQPAHLEAVPTAPAAATLAVMLTGGGARAAYQAGLLKGIARYYPNLRFQVITGVSAGAINAIFLAARAGSLAEKAEQLASMWMELTCDSIYKFDWKTFVPFRSAIASILPSRRWSRRPHGLMDTTPLRELMCRVLDVPPSCPIPGIAENIRAGRLHALALTTLDYTTGQSVRWIQGRNADDFDRPNHRNAETELTVEHVLASAALPFVFPAVRIGDEWHGDGGIRLAAPVSPAVYLGATRIIAMSTGYQKTPAEENRRAVAGYPPAAQILSQLVNAIFLDAIDEDVDRMERVNQMIRGLPVHERGGMKPVDLLVLRPSVDLGKVANEYEKNLPTNLKLLVRALGTKETESPDFLSMLMFEPSYTRRIIEIGEQDIESRRDEIHAFLAQDAQALSSA